MSNVEGAFGADEINGKEESGNRNSRGRNAGKY